MNVKLVNSLLMLSRNIILEDVSDSETVFDYLKELISNKDKYLEQETVSTEYSRLLVWSLSLQEDLFKAADTEDNIKTTFHLQIVKTQCHKILSKIEEICSNLKEENEVVVVGTDIYDSLFKLSTLLEKSDTNNTYRSLLQDCSICKRIPEDNRSNRTKAWVLDLVTDLCRAISTYAPEDKVFVRIESESYGYIPK